MNEMRKLMEAVSRLDEDNSEISPRIKRFFRDRGIKVRMKSVWAGKISNAIAVHPDISPGGYSGYAEEMEKIVAGLNEFAKEHSLEAEVFISGTSVPYFEYKVK